nr:protein NONRESPONDING TO OXYLIPINS 2, mitochondrial-like [Ziziphus jujuba var. spinosa]
MAWRCGSLSRSLISTASRVSSSSIRASPSVSSIPRSTIRSFNLRSRRSLFSVPRNVGALGCTQSLLPLHSAVAAARLTAHISTETRAFCELSQGT